MTWQWVALILGFLWTGPAIALAMSLGHTNTTMHIELTGNLENEDIRDMMKERT